MPDADRPLCRCCGSDRAVAVTDQCGVPEPLCSVCYLLPWKANPRPGERAPCPGPGGEEPLVTPGALPLVLDGRTGRPARVDVCSVCGGVEFYLFTAWPWRAPREPLCLGCNLMLDDARRSAGVPPWPNGRPSEPSFQDRSAAS